MNYIDSRKKYRQELDKLDNEYDAKRLELRKRYLELPDDNEYDGVVSWFSVEKGYGFCRMDNDKDVFIHYTEIQTEEHEDLNEGDIISFNILNNERGLTAKNIIKIS